MENPDARNCIITFKKTAVEKEKYEIAAKKEGKTLSLYISEKIKENQRLSEAILKAKEFSNEYKRKFRYNRTQN